MFFAVYAVVTKFAINGFMSLDGMSCAFGYMKSGMICLDALIE